MIIPLWNTQGEAGPQQYRPHNPTPGDDGKVRKYLFARGTQLILDVHPLSLPYLNDVRVPLLITESALKADAVLSALARAGLLGTLCVISISGVDGWRSDGIPLSDFNDIRWKTTDRHTKRITFRREVIIVFDSDASTNPKVIAARWGLSRFLDRKKARVRYLDVPPIADDPNPKTNKQGIDDALAAGHTIEDMLASAYPAPNIMPQIDLEQLPEDANKTERLEAKNAYLEAENLRLRHERAALIGLITNPYLKSSLKEVLVSTYVEVVQQEADEDGRVEVAAGKIGQDFRESVDVGEEKSKLNKDGSRFLTARSSVKSVIGEAQELKLIDAITVPREKKRKGQGLPEKVWRVKKPTNLAEFLESAVTFEMPGVEPRKSRTQSPICPACGVRHSRRVDTICLGCGAVTDTKTLDVVELTRDDVEADVQHRHAEHVAHRESSLEKNPKVSSSPYQPSASPSPNVSLEKNPKEHKATRIPICKNCSLPRSSDPTPCPNCGSMDRTYKEMSAPSISTDTMKHPRQAEIAGLPSHRASARWTI